MSIANNKVATFHYTLKNADGEQLESSQGGEPLAYLHGAGNIIPGLEKAMLGKAEGDQFEVTVSPAEGYGERHEQLQQRVPLKHLHTNGKPVAGGLAVVQTQQGPRQVRVLKVGRFNADIDANHPLAGQTLTFDVQIESVRDASKEEIAHGHVHGPGGHHHDHDHEHGHDEADETP